MKVSWKWLREYVDLDCDPKEAAGRFTMAGLKVEEVKEDKLLLDGVVTAKILDVRDHPSKKHLKVGVLTQGKDTFSVVSGAPSFQKGKVVALALPGARLASGETIGKKEFDGVSSFGMVLCTNELLTGEEPRAFEDILVFSEDQRLGQDVKEVLDLDDWVIDLELTVNFSHCLSMIGVAIEASAIFNAPMRLPLSLEKWSFAGAKGSVQPSNRVIPEKEGSRFSVSLPDPDLCPRYVGKMMREIQYGYSPVKVERRLYLSGMRPLNSVVDATNYIMLETGQPLHAFDADKIKGNVVYARRSKPGESIVSLDGQKRQLNPGTLVIADQEGPIAIAGVIGGQRTEVTSDTKNILIESAYFDPLSIRLSSQRYNLRTEAAIRFEKGIDPTCQAAVAERTSEFIEALGVARDVPGWIENNVLDVEARRISLKRDTVKRYLWVDIPKGRCKEILSSLRFDVSELSGESDSLFVTVPPRRVDVQEEVDLIEEIARFYGYDAFPAKDMNRVLPGGPPDAKFRRIEKVRDFLASLGGFEVITNSLLSPKDLEVLGWGEDDRRGRPVHLQNPLSSSESVLRTSLLPGLLKVCDANLRTKTQGGLFFEIGNVFFPSEDILPLEERMLGLVSYGTIFQKGFLGYEKLSSFFYMKGVLEKFFKLFGISEVAFHPLASWPFHPGKSAKIMIKGSAVGEIGDLHPLCQKNLDLSLTPTLAWLVLDSIIEFSEEARFKELPRFMASQRDLAVIVSKDIAAGDILSAVKQASHKLTSVEIFDVWEKEPIPEGKKSLALRLTFQPWDKPFTEEELSRERERIVAELKTRFQARER